MEAISDRKTIQEIAADHAIGMRDAAHLSVRADPGEPVEEAVAGGRQRAVHQGQEEQGQGGGTGQGGQAVPADRATADGATASSLPASQGQRSKDQAGLMPSQEVCMPRARHFITFNFTSAFALAHILVGGGREHCS